MKLPTMEEMLEQGTRYDLSPDGRLSLSRKRESIIPGKLPMWYVYYDGVEIHFKANRDADTVGFPTAREARVYLETKSAFDVLVKIGAEAPAGGPREGQGAR